MIDYKNITIYDRTETELQEFLLYCIIVDNNNAALQAALLNIFLMKGYREYMTPFEFIGSLLEQDTLHHLISDANLGNYRRLTKIFKQFIHVDISNLYLPELEDMVGVGPKIARQFITHTKPNQHNIVIFDRSKLEELAARREHNIPIPKSVPHSISRYRELELLYLEK